MDDAILQKDVFQLLVPLLEKHDLPQIISLVLKILDTVFDREMVNNSNKYYLKFESIGGVDALEGLQNHSNQQIYNKVAELIVKYGNGEELQTAEN